MYEWERLYSFDGATAATEVQHQEKEYFCGHKVLTSYLAAVHWDREQRGHKDRENQVNTLYLEIWSACSIYM